jgi:hypothetical protein
MAPGKLRQAESYHENHCARERQRPCRVRPNRRFGLNGYQKFTPAPAGRRFNA